jgi:hypothetical protein
MKLITLIVTSALTLSLSGESKEELHPIAVLGHSDECRVIDELAQVMKCRIIYHSWGPGNSIDPAKHNSLRNLINNRDAHVPTIGEIVKIVPRWKISLVDEKNDGILLVTDTAEGNVLSAEKSLLRLLWGSCLCTTPSKIYLAS